MMTRVRGYIYAMHCQLIFYIFVGFVKWDRWWIETAGEWPVEERLLIIILWGVFSSGCILLDKLWRAK